MLCCATVACGREARLQSTVSARVQLGAPPLPPSLMFVSLASDPTFKRVAVAPLATIEREAFISALSCERVYFSGKRGLCLTMSDDGAHSERSSATVFWADVFNERFERLHRFTLTGLASRVRVSPDGRLAAATMFDAGHSYALAGFSTITTIFDLDAGKELGNLEEFTISRNGAPFLAVDFNFWGVTFARDNDTFYATLATAGNHYLVKGSINDRSAEVIHSGVECPSLSPDDKRIAFKRRVGSPTRGWWQVVVLDLSTMAERPLWNEARSVDDQVDWLDEQHILYSLTGSETGADVWVLSVDSHEPARPFVHAAHSPAVVRR